MIGRSVCSQCGSLEESSWIQTVRGSPFRSKLSGLAEEPKGADSGLKAEKQGFNESQSVGGDVDGEGWASPGRGQKITPLGRTAGRFEFEEN